MRRTQNLNSIACVGRAFRAFPAFIAAMLLAAAFSSNAMARDGLSITLPRALQRPELDYYCNDMLKLAEPQRMFVDRLYEAYVESCQKAEAELMPQLQILSVAGADAFNNDGYVTTTVELYRQFVNQQEVLADRIEFSERQMMDQIPSILAQPQLDMWPRVLATRQRARMRPWSFDHRSAAIDLSRLVRNWELPPDTRQQVDLILPEYESQLTQLWKDLDRECESRQVRKIEAFSRSNYDDDGQRVDTSTAEGRARWATFHEEFLATLRESAQLQQRVERLNRTWISRICDLIPSDRRRDCEMQFLLLAYRLIYRDDADPRLVVQKVLRDRNVADDQHAAIEALLAEFDTAYRGISVQMEREYVPWCDQFARTCGSNGFDDYSTEMRRLREQRWRLIEQFVANVANLLPSEILRPYAADIAKLRQAITTGRAEDMWTWPGQGIV